MNLVTHLWDDKWMVMDEGDKGNVNFHWSIKMRFIKSSVLRSGILKKILRMHVFYTTFVKR